MKKFLVYTSVLIILLFNSCRKNCHSNFTFYEIPNRIYEYMGVYKDGNYWIYANKDSSIIDSVFIEKLEVYTEKEDCDFTQVIECNLSGMEHFSLNSFKMFRGYLKFYEKNIDYYVENMQIENKEDNYSKGDSLVVEAPSHTINNIVYNDVIIIRKYDYSKNLIKELTLAKDKGIVSYWSDSFPVDTFNLTKIN